jgi:hypothetical protein
MTPAEVLDEAQAAGVTLWAKGDALRYRGRREVILSSRPTNPPSWRPSRTPTFRACPPSLRRSDHAALPSPRGPPPEGPRRAGP